MEQKSSYCDVLSRWFCFDTPPEPDPAAITHPATAFAFQDGRVCPLGRCDIRTVRWVSVSRWDRAKRASISLVTGARYCLSPGIVRSGRPWSGPLLRHLLAIA